MLLTLRAALLCLVYKKNDIVDMVKDISISADRNTVSIHEIVITTEEQASASNDVASDSEGLSRLALSLKDMIRIFKV